MKLLKFPFDLPHDISTVVLQSNDLVSSSSDRVDVDIIPGKSFCIDEGFLHVYSLSLQDFHVLFDVGLNLISWRVQLKKLFSQLLLLQSSVSRICGHHSYSIAEMIFNFGDNYQNNSTDNKRQQRWRSKTRCKQKDKSTCASISVVKRGRRVKTVQKIQ